MTSITFQRENDLQSQINEKTQGLSFWNNIKNGVSDLLGRESSYSKSYTFKKKYRLNTGTLENSKIQNLEDYMKSKFIEINDPSYFIHINNNNKHYILQGDLQIKKTDKIAVSFRIFSNLPLFSAIKFIQLELNEHSVFNINKIYSLCTNEQHSDRRCDKYIDNVINNYYGMFHEEYDDNDIDLKNKSIHNQLKGHYSKLDINGDNNNTDKNEDNYPIFLENGYINLLIFFIDENTISILNKTDTKDFKHKNTLGDIAFVIEPLMI
jgi:hypothetical protein